MKKIAELPKIDRCKAMQAAIGAPGFASFPSMFMVRRRGATHGIDANNWGS
jgi:hypothetical protein